MPLLLWVVALADLHSASRKGSPAQCRAVSWSWRGAGVPPQEKSGPPESYSSCEGSVCAVHVTVPGSQADPPRLWT